MIPATSFFFFFLEIHDTNWNICYKASCINLTYTQVLDHEILSSFLTEHLVIIFHTIWEKEIYHFDLFIEGILF